MNKDGDQLFIIEEQGGAGCNRSFRGLWIEDAFLGDSEENNDLFSNLFLGKSITLRRIRVLLGVVLLGLFILWGRVFQLQVLQGGRYSSIADVNRIRSHYKEPLRGIMYDRFGKQLVQNIPSFALYVIPADLPRDTGKRLAAYHEVYKLLRKYGEERPEEDFSNELEGKVEKNLYVSYQPILLKENLLYEEFILFKILTNALSGVSVNLESKRLYELEENSARALSLSNIYGYLGRVNEDDLKADKEKLYGFNSFTGKTGLEMFYEKTLRGKLGKETIEVDAMGKARKIISSEAPEIGGNLLLSLDFELQAQVENALKKQLGKLGLKKGAAIVMDPDSGEIQSLVSLPSFDGNLFARGLSLSEYQRLVNDPSNPLFFRAVSGEYPAGSTFKPVMAAAALEEGIVNANTVVQSTGGLRVDQWFFPDWKAGGHGLVNVTRALSESVNTFFYLAGGGDMDKFEGLGVYRIKQYAEQFGLGKRTGLDLGGEAAGFVPSPEWKEKAKKEKWYIGDTYHLSIGQGDLLVTPLQVASFTAALANGGTVYRPHLVKKIISNDFADQEVSKEVINKADVSDENLEIVRLGMRKAVVSGTAKMLEPLGLTIAGKTGTAQWKTGEKNHAWFTSFAPLKHPRIVVTVLLEAAGEGNEFAVPVAYDIYDWYKKNRW